MELNELELEALSIIKNLKEVIIPQEFTYLNHSSSVMMAEEKERTGNRQSWTYIPIDSFTIKKDMSFITREQRLKYVAEKYGNPLAAPISYTPNRDISLPFEIKVLFPQRNLTKAERDKLGIDDKGFQKLIWSHDGLGDYRHPKLSNKTEVIIFGSSQIDDITGTDIDVVYGVPKEFLIVYAQRVSEEYLKLKGRPIQNPSLPQNPDESRSVNRDLITMPKNADNSRYLGNPAPYQLELISMQNNQIKK